MKFTDTSTRPLDVISVRIISNRKKGVAVVCDGHSDSDEESPATADADTAEAFMKAFEIEQLRRLTEHYSAPIDFWEAECKIWRHTSYFK